MKLTCKVKEVANCAAEMYCVEKKSAITQKFFTKFMNLPCINEDDKNAMKQIIKAEREKDPAKYFNEVRKQFITKFYEADCRKPLEETF